MLWFLLATLWVVPPEVYPLAGALATGLAAVLGAALFLSGWRLTSPGLGFLAALALAMGISHAFAEDVGASVDTVIRLGGLLVVFVTARRLSAAARRGTAVLLVAAAAVLAIHGLWQFFIGFDRMLATPHLDPAVAVRLQTYRVFSRFLLPSTFASFLLLALPTGAGLTPRSAGWSRWLVGGATVAIFVALLLTQSHGAIVALLSTAVVWSVASARRGIRTRALALAVSAVLLLGVVMAMRGGVLLGDRRASGPAALRWGNWRAAVLMIEDRPLTGVGGGGFGSAYTRYRRPGDNETRYAHNTYLQVLAEHGLPMAIPLGGLLLACTTWICRTAREGEPPAMGMAFGLTAFLVHNVWDFSALVTAPLWTAAALAGTLAASASDERHVPSSFRWPSLASVGAVALLVIGGVTGVRSGVARWRLATARQATASGNPARALTFARQAEAWAPWQAENPMFVAEDLLARAKPGSREEMALAAASRAVVLNRSWPAAHAARARALLAAGDAGAAAVEIDIAARLYPLSARYPRELAALAGAVVARNEVEP
ncbi:MAG: O-antigen ligase family protein [Acidobacteriota bacterium]